MFCKNCGSSVDPNAAVCIHCGTPTGQGSNYCINCGSAITPGAAVCTTCGCTANAIPKHVAAVGAKSKMTAGLLGIFLGCYGVHNFYLGYTGKGVIQLVLTVVGIILACIYIGFFIVFGVWIWTLIESIMIFSGSINTDANGIPLKD